MPCGRSHPLRRQEAASHRPSRDPAPSVLLEVDECRWFPHQGRRPRRRKVTVLSRRVEIRLVGSPQPHEEGPQQPAALTIGSPRRRSRRISHGRLLNIGHNPRSLLYRPTRILKCYAVCYLSRRIYYQAIIRDENLFKALADSTRLRISSASDRRGLCLPHPRELKFLPSQACGTWNICAGRVSWRRGATVSGSLPSCVAVRSGRSDDRGRCSSRAHAHRRGTAGTPNAPTSKKTGLLRAAPEGIAGWPCCDSSGGRVLASKGSDGDHDSIGASGRRYDIRGYWKRTTCHSGLRDHPWHDDRRRGTAGSLAAPLSSAIETAHCSDRLRSRLRCTGHGLGRQLTDAALGLRSARRFRRLPVDDDAEFRTVFSEFVFEPIARAQVRNPFRHPWNLPPRVPRPHRDAQSL